MRGAAQNFLAALVVGSAAAAVALAAVHAANSRATPPVTLRAVSRPASSSLLEEDKGKFRILVNGQEVGKEEFQISTSGENWMARGTTEIESAGKSSRVTGTLLMHPDATPLHYEWKTEGAKKASSTTEFDGPKATLVLEIPGARPFTQQFIFNSPRVVILDNNLYHHYVILARIYDWQKKGAQTFSVLVPQQMTPGSITVESLGQQVFRGKSVEELRVKTEDLEVDLFLDGLRLIRLVAPSSNAEALRE